MESKKRGRKPKTEDYYNSVFASRLRALINNAGITLPDLADSIGATRQSIGQWKDGKTQPNATMIKKIAEYFNVSSDYLLGLSDVATRNETIQGINAAIGLSSRAITMLMAEKALNESDIADFISFLVESEKLQVLISSILCGNFYANTDEYTYIPTPDNINPFCLNEIDNVPLSAVYKYTTENIFWNIVSKYKTTKEAK